MTEHVGVPGVAMLNEFEAKVVLANANVADLPFIPVGLVAPCRCLLAVNKFA